MIEYYKKLSKTIEFRDGVPYWIDKGELAGDINPSTGYLRIGCSIDGIRKRIVAHRLHWYMVHGYVPTTMDHIDRRKMNNNIENLREVTHSQSTRNAIRLNYGTSKYRGIHRNHKNNNWTVCITDLFGERIHVHGFHSEEAAAKEFDRLAVALGVAEHTPLNFSRVLNET